jgi:hypothetical protein
VNFLFPTPGETPTSNSAGLPKPPGAAAGKAPGGFGKPALFEVGVSPGVGNKKFTARQIAGLHLKHIADRHDNESFIPKPSDQFLGVCARHAQQKAPGGFGKPALFEVGVSPGVGNKKFTARQMALLWLRLAACRQQQGDRAPLLPAMLGPPPRFAS